MTYDEFADTYQAEVALIHDNTLTINAERAESLIRQNRDHALTFFNDQLEALEVLGERGAEPTKSRKLLQLYDLLLFQIATFFENEEDDGSLRERLVQTMTALARNL